jgi:hypothetical protein
VPQKDQPTAYRITAARRLALREQAPQALAESET